MYNTMALRSHTIPLLTHISTKAEQNLVTGSFFKKEKFKHAQNWTVPPFTIFYTIKIVKGQQAVKKFQPVAFSIMYT